MAEGEKGGRLHALVGELSAVTVSLNRTERYLLKKHDLSQAESVWLINPCASHFTYLLSTYKSTSTIAYTRLPKVTLKKPHITS